MIRDEDDDRPGYERADEDHCDDGIDPEGPDPSEIDYSDEPDLEICPNCRKLVHDETEQCPHCHEYITPISQPSWAYLWVFVVALLLFGMLLIPFFFHIH